MNASRNNPESKSSAPSAIIIVPIVAKTIDGAKVQIHASTGDIVELRMDALDSMENVSTEQLQELVAMGKIIMTDRRAYEGGHKAQTDTQRFDDIHRAIEAKPWAVDIEIQSPRLFRRKLIKLANQNGVKVISSYHNFKRTPPFDKLAEMAKEALGESDYAKIVCLPENDGDITALLDLVRQHPGRVAAFGLGDKPAQSHTRILSLKLGAPFGYARGHQPTAPGQMTVEEMRKQLAGMQFAKKDDKK
ncbi:type I 3-dehydroquinate dehydratase [Candidatus Micrarchaeota archaeon]|nr:type I 3-dehydroquinate dehydratase [Candidatus Micrarchaeota archaeon]